MQEGRLLIEDGQIVGATAFVTCQWDAPSTNRLCRWIWTWIFIDPEHRRRGITVKRLPEWIARYGPLLVVDQPNRAAVAMLQKVGCADQITIKCQPEMHQGNTEYNVPLMSLHNYARLYCH